MAAAAPSRVLLCAAESASVDDVRRLLEREGHGIQDHTLAAAEPADLSACRLVVVDGTRQAPAALELCRRLRGRTAEDFLPLLFVTADHAPGARLASLECGADAYLLRPFDPAELLAQTRALLRIKDGHDRLTEKTAEVNRINKRLQVAYQHIDQELELARRIQQSFLPHTLPEVPQVRFAVHYQPCGQVGGDFYDVFRLDERHIGFYVADAMGHGVPASLLTIFVKKGVRAKEIFGQQYRLVPPGEVLQRLNRDLIEQRLSETPFITMVYALYNFHDRTFQFARSGHPYPVYLPHDGAPVQWQIEGSLLGVFDTSYPVRSHPLRPGDKVLIYTDGMDAAAFDERPVGTASLLAAAAHHRALPVHELVPRLAQELFAQTRQVDDLTVFGLEVLG
ncbi:MAG: SpoIIE family protein phosphatase [Gemmataceae bacterium]|nr:SpoIIE family protein phosphatase [Gemmataceae bacterium]